ncbi:hypothetical protein V3C99_011733 [Haemonchus contortus]
MCNHQRTLAVSTTFKTTYGGIVGNFSIKSAVFKSSCEQKSIDGNAIAEFLKQKYIEGYVFASDNATNATNATGFSVPLLYSSNVGRNSQEEISQTATRYTIHPSIWELLNSSSECSSTPVRQIYGFRAWVAIRVTKPVKITFNSQQSTTCNGTKNEFEVEYRSGTVTAYIDYDIVCIQSLAGVKVNAQGVYEIICNTTSSLPALIFTLGVQDFTLQGSDYVV